jgi:hypothetical protein
LMTVDPEAGEGTVVGKGHKVRPKKTCPSPPPAITSTAWGSEN